MKGDFSDIKKIASSLIITLLISIPLSPLIAAELNSASYTIDEYEYGSGDSINSTNFSITGNIDQAHKSIFSVSNLPLIAGTVNTCGKINSAGTYTLSGDINGISGPCFIVAADGVTIDGAGYTVTASGSNTSYAVTATSSLVGGDAYGTTTIQDITFSGFSGGIDASGNTVTSGTTAGGNGGRVTIQNATLGTTSVSGGDALSGGGDAGSAYLSNVTHIASSTLVYADGGSSTVCGFGGNGGDVILVDSTSFIASVEPGESATTTIAEGGGCSNPPSGSYGSRGQINISETNSPQTGGSTGSEDNQSNRVGSQAQNLLDRLLPKVEFRINLPKLILPDLPIFGSGEDSFSFIDKITSFLNSNTFNTLKNRFYQTPGLLNHLGINNVYDLFVVQNNPKRIFDTNQVGLFTLYSETRNTPFNTYITTNPEGEIIQLVRVNPGQNIIVSLIPTNTNKNYKAVFDGIEVEFVDNKLEINALEKIGRYVLSSSVTPVVLYIDVVNYNVDIETQKHLIILFIEKIIEFVHKLFSFILF